MTGSVDAAANAQDAFASFLGYLEALPAEAKTTLLALTNSSGENIASVIGDLRVGDCVEIASKSLQTIIEQSTARVFLNRHPRLSPDYLRALIKDYRAPHKLSTKAEDSSLTLPPVFLNRVVSKIQIDSAYDYISLLLSFPITLYKQLLQYANGGDALPLPLELAERINEDILSDEQKQAFFGAIEANRSRFSKEARLYFYILSGYTHGVSLLFGALRPRERLLAIAKKMDADGNTVLHWATANPDILRAILELIPETRRLAAVTEKDNDGNTVLHLASINPDALRTILELLPASDHLAAVKEKNNAGDTVLHWATEHPASLRAVLDIYPERERFVAVKEKNSDGDTVFHWANVNTDSLRTLLDLYPERERFAAVTKKDKYGDTVLHLASVNLTSLSTILKLLPPDKRLAAIHEKSEYDGDTVLHRAATHSELWDDILVLCANTTGLPITAPISEVSGLIERIAACQISANDKALNDYVAQARIRAEAAEDIDSLKIELNKILRSVSSVEVLAVKHEIATLRGGVTLISIGKNKKADDIENKLCALPLDRRGKVLSEEHNAVQDAIGRRRLLGTVDGHSRRLERLINDTPSESHGRGPLS
jgi:ankyrin repeat protein